MKVNVSTSLEEKVAERVERLAREQETSEAAIIRRCVTKCLPDMEREVLGAQFVGGVKSRRQKVAA